MLDVDLDDAACCRRRAPFADALADAPSRRPLRPSAPASQQAEAVVGVREAGVTVARAERLPSVSLARRSAASAIRDGCLPGAGDFRTNWSLGAAVQVPIFTGGRLKAERAAARAPIWRKPRRGCEQARELADARRGDRARISRPPKAVWEASAGTVQQAERAYQIAELRNREGLSTQLELSDSRLALQVAQANRAQAARDVQVARARVALLPNLPVGRR